MKNSIITILFLTLVLKTNILKAQNCTINAGTDILLCQTLTDTLRGNGAGIFQVNPYWSIGGYSLNISDSLNTKTAISGFQRGTNYLITLKAVCGDGSVITDQVKIIGGLIPATPFAGNDTTVCAGQGFIQLSGSNPGQGATGYWSVINSKGKFSADSSKSQAKFFPQINTCDSITRVLLSWTINNGQCTSNDMIQISFIGGNRLSAGKPKVVKCANKVTLSASCTGGKNHTGYWEIMSGPAGAIFSDITNPSATLSNLQVGTYTLKWHLNGICYNGNDTTSVEVISTIPPTPANAGVQQYFCLGSQPNAITLKGNTPGPGEVVQWQQLSGPKATITNDTAIQTTVTGVNYKGSYRFQYSIINGVCVSSAVSAIYIDSTAYAEGGPDLILPANYSIADFTPKSTGGTYKLLSGPTTTVTNGTKSTGLNQIGKYTYLYTYTNKCGTYYDTVSVFASLTPSSANAGTDQTYKCGVNFGSLAANLPQIGTGTWSQVSGPSMAFIADSSSATTQISQLQEGTYKFRWTISGGVNAKPSFDDINIVVSTKFKGKANAGIDRHVLAGRSIYMTATAAGSTENGYWRQIKGNSLNLSDTMDPSAVVAGFQNGQTYKLIWTVFNGCGESIDTMTIFTDYNESAAITNGDQCLSANDTQVVLRAQDPSPSVGHWEFIGGTHTPVVKYNGIDTLILGINQSGTYNYRWVVVDQAGAIAADTVTILKLNQIVYANAGEDFEVCRKEFKLSGNTTDYGTYNWSSNRIFSATFKDSSYLNANVSDSGLYTFRYTIDQGVCGSSWDEVNVFVREAPQNPFAGNDTVLYQTSRYRLGATVPSKGAGVWKWIDSEKGNPTIINPSNPYTSVSGLETGLTRLRWMVSTANICPVKSDTVEIYVMPSALTYIKQTGCANGLTELNPGDSIKSNGIWEQIAGTKVTLQFPGNGGTGQGNVNSRTAFVVSPAAGTYVFKYTETISGNRARYIIDTLTILENPNANAGKDQTLPYKDSRAFFLFGTGGQNGRWMQVSGPGCNILSPSSKTSVVKYSASGTYVFRYFATNNICESFDEVTIEVLPKDTTDGKKPAFHAGVFVPNTFTPDGNGLNDKFKPESSDSLSYEMLIFNRWGEIISRSTEKESGWDGTYKQDYCPQENYFYIITYLASSKDGQFDGGTLSGQLLLLR